MNRGGGIRLEARMAKENRALRGGGNHWRGREVLERVGSRGARSGRSPTPLQKDIPVARLWGAPAAQNLAPEGGKKPKEFFIFL